MTLVCPAPVPGTVDDFWQMAWDQQINIVVMLTKTMEGSKVCHHTHSYTYACSYKYIPTDRVFELPNLQRKSEDYYPESPAGMLNCGRFQIRTISLKYHVDYEVRVLEVAQVRNKLYSYSSSSSFIISSNTLDSICAGE